MTLEHEHHKLPNVGLSADADLDQVLDSFDKEADSGPSSEEAAEKVRKRFVPQERELTDESDLERGSPGVQDKLSQAGSNSTS